MISRLSLIQYYLESNVHIWVNRVPTQRGGNELVSYVPLNWSDCHLCDFNTRVKNRPKFFFWSRGLQDNAFDRWHYVEWREIQSIGTIRRSGSVLDWKPKIWTFSASCVYRLCIHYSLNGYLDTGPPNMTLTAQRTCITLTSTQLRIPTVAYLVRCLCVGRVSNVNLITWLHLTAWVIGSLRADGTRQDVDRNFVLNFYVVDENLSWYIDENIGVSAFAEYTMFNEKLIQNMTVDQIKAVSRLGALYHNACW